MSKTLEELVVGDRVWVSTGREPRHGIRTVAKVTPKQIEINLHGGRYRRDNGLAVSSGGVFRRIAVATPEECAEWEAEQRAKAEEVAAHRQRLAEQEARRQELIALLPEHASVEREPNNGAGEWHVSLYLKDEEAVKRLAALLTQHAG